MHLKDRRTGLTDLLNGLVIQPSQLLLCRFDCTGHTQNLCIRILDPGSFYLIIILSKHRHRSHEHHQLSQLFGLSVLCDGTFRCKILRFLYQHSCRSCMNSKFVLDRIFKCLHSFILLLLCP